jgi:predicted acylesterase/phospholipase RssA
MVYPCHPAFGMIDQITDKDFHARVLSIDGGGVRGIIPATMLLQYETVMQAKLGDDFRVVDSFDVIAGTSTGGLIALAVALRIPMRSIVNMYLDESDTIFPRSLFWDATGLRNVWKILGPSYSHSGLRQTVEKFLKDNGINPNGELGDMVREVHEKAAKAGKLLKKDKPPPCAMVASYSLTHRCPIRFCNYIKPMGQSNMIHRPGMPELRYSHPDDFKFSVVDAVMSTTAAPTYLPSHRSTAVSGNNVVCVDGGVCLNNPSNEITADCTVLFPNSKKLSVISLSCGSVNIIPRNDHKVVTDNLLPWALEIFSLSGQAVSYSTDESMRRGSSNHNPGHAGDSHGFHRFYLRLNLDLNDRCGGEVGFTDHRKVSLMHEQTVFLMDARDNTGRLQNRKLQNKRTSEEKTQLEVMCEYIESDAPDGYRALWSPFIHSANAITASTAAS